MISFVTDTTKEKPLSKRRGEMEFDNIETPTKQNRDSGHETKMTNDLTISRTFKLGVYWEEFREVKS